MGKFKQLYTVLCTSDECILKTRLEEDRGGGVGGAATHRNVAIHHTGTRGAGLKGKQSDRRVVKMKIER